MSRFVFGREPAERVLGGQAQFARHAPHDRPGDRPRGSGRGSRGGEGPRPSGRASPRSRSPTPATPRTCPSMATKTGLRPSAIIASAAAAVSAGTCRRRLDVRAVADADVVAVEAAGDPLPRHFGHVLDGSHEPHRTAERSLERARDRVRRLRLERARELERRILAVPPRHRGPPFGERAGLVEQHRADLAQPLQRVGVLHEDPATRGTHQRHRQRQGDREPDGARTRDDQQRDDALEGEAGPRSIHTGAGDDGERQQRLDEVPRHEVGRARAAPASCESASCTTASNAPTRVFSPAASTRTMSRAPRFVAPAVTVSPSRTGTGAGSRR